MSIKPAQTCGEQVSFWCIMLVSLINILHLSFGTKWRFVQLMHTSLIHGTIHTLKL